MRQSKDDRRSRRSRRLITDALLALLREKRFDRITVQEIIDRADVGRSTFYAQFRNKEDVLISEVERVFGLLHEEHLATAEAPADQLLPSLELFRHVQERQPLYPALVCGPAIDPHYQAVHRALRDRAAQRLALTTGANILAVPPEIVADYLAGALLTMIHWWLDHGLPYPPERMEAFFQKLAMPGVRALLHHERAGTDQCRSAVTGISRAAARDSASPGSGAR